MFQALISFFSSGYWDVSLPRVRSLVKTKVRTNNRSWVSPFGNLRVTGCLAPYRRLSQPNRVLHRSFQSRHPPYALTASPIRRPINHFLSVCFFCSCSCSWFKYNLITYIGLVNKFFTYKSYAYTTKIFNHWSFKINTVWHNSIFKVHDIATKSP